MTEEEWLSDDLETLLGALDTLAQSQYPRDRFMIACCRRVWDLLRDARSREALETLENYIGCDLHDAVHEYLRDLSGAASREAGGHDTSQPRTSAEFSAALAVFDAVRGLYDEVARSAARSVAAANWPLERAAVFEAESGGLDLDAGEQHWQIGCLRCIFGNPFRPVAFDPAWRTDTAVAIARQVYDSREFGAMPILADALQDAGCEDDAILHHCRDANQPHVRGCWVCDLVLGKE